MKNRFSQYSLKKNSLLRFSWPAGSLLGLSLFQSFRKVFSCPTLQKQKKPAPFWPPPQLHPVALHGLL